MTPFERARTDCYQDMCENSPFASVGGLENRVVLTAPKWIPPEEVVEYLRGYEAAALEAYGPEWRTCAFGWSPAITILGNTSTV